MSLHAVSFRLNAGEFLSDPVDCSNYDSVVRIIMPNEWTGAAPLTFQLSRTVTTYYDLIA
jgi:hypothetical protein